jgi:ABC-type bacteriocin/lantibiotic exporter with double-glycine peptidase domain
MKEFWIKVVAYFTAMHEESQLKTHLILGSIGFMILCVLIAILVVLIINFSFPMVLLVVIIIVLFSGGIWGCGELVKKLLKIKDKKKDSKYY